jgi:predicted HTH domain antitoxin
MEYLQRVRKTDLARNTRQVIRNVQRGQTVLVESHGQAEAAILDILDYRILRAFMVYHTRPPKVNPQGLSADLLKGLDDPQRFFDLVLAHYLTEAISLGRAAELLELPALDLQARFQRLDVPLKFGSKDEQAARDEVNVARDY